MKLHVLDGVAAVPETPDGFLDVLPGPTLIRLRGRRRDRVRVVGALLHGNEPSGLRAVHAVLHAGVVPATDVAIFIGGVEAARAEPRHSRRIADGRRDLNRCFRAPFEGEDGVLAAAVLEQLRSAPFEAGVDLHNNSGRNPAYALGLQRTERHLALCGLFADRFVHSRLRLGTFSEALDDLGPMITVECGRAGEPTADAAAIAGLRRFVSLDVLPAAPEAALTVLGGPVRVRVRPGTSLEFARAPGEAALTLDPEIDRHNFEVLPAGTVLGWINEDSGWPLSCVDEEGREVSHILFELAGPVLRARTSFVPIMMTTRPEAVLADCLCYAVQPG